MSILVEESFKFLWPFQNVRTLQDKTAVRVSTFHDLFTSVFKVRQTIVICEVHFSNLSISQKKLFQKIILSLKFEWEGISNFKLRIVSWNNFFERLGDLKTILTI